MKIRIKKKKIAFIYTEYSRHVCKENKRERGAVGHVMKIS